MAKETIEAVPVVRDRNILGETPIWSVEEQALYWVDVKNPMIHRLLPATGARKSWTIETEIGSIGFGPPGKLICGLRTGFALFDLATGKHEVLADPEGKGRLNPNRLNDGKVDPAGRYWCGSMQDPGHGPVGTLYRLDTDRTVHGFESDIRIPNGLAWSPDGRRMYFCDSLSRRMQVFDYDPATGERANGRVFFTVPEDQGVPDGATVDAEGCLWNAHIFGGRVTRYDPEGKPMMVVRLPTPRTTACCFGGANLDVLYVTTASMQMSREQLAADSYAGNLFAVEVGIKGRAEPRFRA
jgi:sugar lactone lactonase YvrE